MQFIMLKSCITYFYPSNYVLLLGEASLCTIIYLIVAYILSFDKEEKLIIGNGINKIRGSTVKMIRNLLA